MVQHKQTCEKQLDALYCTYIIISLLYLIVVSLVLVVSCLLLSSIISFLANFASALARQVGVKQHRPALHVREVGTHACALLQRAGGNVGQLTGIPCNQKPSARH